MIDLVKDANNSGMRLSLENGELFIRVSKGRVIDNTLVERLRTEKESLKEYFTLAEDEFSPAEKFAVEKAVPGIVDGNAYYPVSPVQAYWIDPELDKEYKSKDDVHGRMLIAYEIKGRLDMEALVKAIGSLIAYHEGLRLTFHFIDGDYKMRVEDAADDRYRPVFYTRPGSGELSAWDLNTPGELSLDQAPLFRAHITTMENAWYLSLHLPHAIMDNWAVDLMQNDLFFFYRCHATGKQAELPPPAFRYRDFIYSENKYRQKNYPQHKAFWQSRFTGLPAYPMLLGKSGMNKPLKEKQLRVESIFLDQQAYDKLTSLAASHQCALFTILHAAFRNFLFTITGHGDVLLGTYVLGRDYPGTEKLIGCFAKTKLMRVALEETDQLGDIIRKVREHDQQSEQYDACSLKDAMEDLLPAGFPKGSAFWNINLQFTNHGNANVDDPSEAIRYLRETGLVLNRMPYLLNELIAIDMQFLFVATGARLIAECQYDSSTYNSTEIASLLADFNDHISSIVL